MDQIIIPNKLRKGRDAFRCVIIGEPGCGKSTLAYALMQQAKRALMVLPDHDDWADALAECKAESHSDFKYKGVKHHIYKNDDLLNNVYKSFQDGMICFDDPASYMPSDPRGTPVAFMLSRTRQMMCDTIVMAHGFSLVPPLVFNYVTHFIIFKPLDHPSERKDKLKHMYPIVCEAVERVKEKAKTNPNYFEVIQKI